MVHLEMKIRNGVFALFAAMCVSAVQVSAAPPFKGLVLWPDEARKYPALSRQISLEFAYCLPCDVENDWTVLEETLDDIASRRHQAVLRFRYVHPGEKTRGVRGRTAVPDGIRSRGDYHETYARNPGGDGPTYYPDWSCEALKDWTLAFYERFAAKYDRDPRIAFVEVGFGHWAEYHTSGTVTRLGVNFPDRAFQVRFAQKLNEIFVETPWLVSIDAADVERSPLAESVQLELGFGLFDDSFMHAKHEIASGDGYSERCWRAFGLDRWQYAPAGGEISYYSRNDQRKFLSPAGIHGVTWEAAAAKYHVTFMTANDSMRGSYATADRFASAADACGYHIKVVSRTWSAEKGLEATLANDGVAPVYHRVFPTADGVRCAEPLGRLLPGAAKAFSFPTAGSDAEIELDSDKLPKGMTIPVVPLGGWPVPDPAKAVFHIDSVERFPKTIGGYAVCTEFLPDGEPVDMSKRKWKVAKRASVRYARDRKTGQYGWIVNNGKPSSVKTNLSHLNLTYNVKKGTFRGSFIVYVLGGTAERPRLKRMTARVSGSVVNGRAWGVATIKNVGSFEIGIF